MSNDSTRQLLKAFANGEISLQEIEGKKIDIDYSEIDYAACTTQQLEEILLIGKRVGNRRYLTPSDPDLTAEEREKLKALPVKVKRGGESDIPNFDHLPLTDLEHLLKIGKE